MTYICEGSVPLGIEAGAKVAARGGPAERRGARAPTLPVPLRGLPTRVLLASAAAPRAVPICSCRSGW